MKIKILWPDGPRLVSESWVRMQAQDSWWNHAPAYRCRTCGQDTLTDNGCSHDECDPMYPEDTPRPDTTEEALEWLSDTGEVTFAKDCYVPCVEADNA